MISFRTMLPRDRQFIISAWSGALRKSEYRGMIADDDWADVMHRQIGRMIDRPDINTTVAFDPESEPGVADLFGFIAANAQRTPPVVAMVYVKQAYRRAGLGRRLFAAAGVDPRLPFDYVCRTVFCDELADKIPHATFRPVLARRRAA